MSSRGRSRPPSRSYPKCGCGHEMTCSSLRHPPDMINIKQVARTELSRIQESKRMTTLFHLNRPILTILRQPGIRNIHEAAYKIRYISVTTSQRHAPRRMNSTRQARITRAHCAHHAQKLLGDGSSDKPSTTGRRDKTHTHGATLAGHLHRTTERKKPVTRQGIASSSGILSGTCMLPEAVNQMSERAKHATSRKQPNPETRI